MLERELLTMPDEELIEVYEAARAQPGSPLARRALRAIEHRARRNGSVDHATTGASYRWSEAQDSVVKGRLGTAVLATRRLERRKLAELARRAESA